jgi:acyl dehydratase
MARAALPAVPGLGSVPGLRRSGSGLPDLTLERRSVPVDPAHVRSYAQVCAFPDKDALPLTYLHMLAFPLHMTMLTDSSFPFPAMGLVHLENTFRQHRRVTSRDRFDVQVRAADLRPHARGRTFDMLTEIRADGELVWEEVSTYLRRGRGDDAAAPGLDIPPAQGPGVEWRLPADLGRRYAAVSGDRNPIHLYAVTAKAFGFPRQIAHGMWSLARCVAAIENRLTDRVLVDAAFKTPVVLPSTVRFATSTAQAATETATATATETPTATATATSDLQRGAAGGLLFGLSNPRSDAPHLTARATPLP